jgi:hypothetical protein
MKGRLWACRGLGAWNRRGERCSLGNRLALAVSALNICKECLLSKLMHAEPIII